MIKFEVDQYNLTIKLVKIPKLRESELLRVHTAESKYLGSLTLSIQDKECNVTLRNTDGTFNWGFPLGEKIVFFTESGYNKLIRAFNRLPSLISYDIKEGGKAIPKVMFKVKQLPLDLGFEILGLDYDNTAKFDIKKWEYRFKLSELGLEIREISNRVFSIIMRDPGLTPLSTILNCKTVVGTYELEHLVKLLNESQRDVFFEIIVCAFRA